MAKSYLDKDGLLYFWQKLKTTFALISHTHTQSQITDFPTSMPPTSHTHGNITNLGALLNTDVAIASGDRLVITDSTNSHKITRASLSFDGSTATKALTQKGTFETFNNYTHPSYTAKTAAAVKVGNDATGHVVIGAALTAADVGALPNTTSIPTKTSDLTNDSGFVSDSSYVHTDNNYTTTEKNKLSNIAEGAEVNQNAFSNVKVGSTTVAADSKTDILELVAGNNITLTPDATNDKVTIAFNGTIPTIPNNFGTVKVGSISVFADTTSDTLELVAGTNITLTPDETNDKITITNAITDASYLTVTASTANDVLALSGSEPTDTDDAIDLIANNVVPMSWVGVSIATLDGNGKVPSSQLPSYVDDVIEAYARSGQTALSSTWLATGSASGTVITPEAGKIYVLMADSGDYSANTQFRWGGSAYVKLNDGGVSAITNAEIDTIVAS